MYTFSGREIHIESGVPSLMDIAVQLGRIPRWAGATRTFYPVLLHCCAVSDLLPDELKVYGLLHDATELWFSDIPGPVKPESIKRKEAFLIKRIYRSLDIRCPSKAARSAVKSIDIRMRIGEAHVLGVSWYKKYSKDPDAERVVKMYAANFGYKDFLEPEGAAVVSYVNRVLRAKARV